jgi:hypothetical protein
MTENGSDPLPLEPPEQGNIRLREENVRLRPLLVVHRIPIPQLPAENPPPTRTAKPSPPVDKEEHRGSRCFEADVFRFSQFMDLLLGVEVTATVAFGHS